MATNRSFQAMINDYLTIDLLRCELKRMYLLDKVKKDNSWIGGNGTQGFVVPFIDGKASSICFGSLTAAGDVAEDAPIRATLTVQPELWGTMMFNSKDFMQHDGKKRELSLMKAVKSTVDPFMTFMKSALSDVLVGGPHFATVTGVTNAATGHLQFDRIEKFSKGMKVIVREAVGPTAVVGYVMAINKSTGDVLFNTTRVGGVATNYVTLGGVLGVQVGDVVYYDGLVSTVTGAIQNQFTSLRSTLLSAANGGATTLYGLTKTTYPFLQALNISGATLTSSNVLEELFRIYVEEIELKTMSINDKKADNYWLSPKNYARVMICLEKYKGQYYTVPGKKDVSVYAWQNITVGNGAGAEITFSKVPELANDIIPCVNWETFLLASNGYFRFNENPNDPGKIHYFETRAATGYVYYIDACFMGDLLNICPESNAIIYSVSL